MADKIWVSSLHDKTKSISTHPQDNQSLEYSLNQKWKGANLGKTHKLCASSSTALVLQFWSRCIWKASNLKKSYIG